MQNEFIHIAQLRSTGDEEKKKMSFKELNRPRHQNDVIVTLKYRDSKPAVSEIKVISKPGCKKYVNFKVSSKATLKSWGYW